jgi:hypothetical protein
MKIYTIQKMGGRDLKYEMIRNTTDDAQQYPNMRKDTAVKTPL